MSSAALAPEIVRATVGDEALLKEIDYAGADLAAGETISALGSIAIYAVDCAWRNPTASAAITVVSHGTSGTIGQVKIDGLDEVGRYLIEIPGITSEGQVLIAQCRLLVEE